ncbi:zinc finger protein 2 [Dendroctonus ponderosae]|uniref:zinc finger protein 2 n=1 Tax=Dendroctonus ponderosae TaxID=77166 RepID=UPI002035296F|nr:zinc finger protein 2 [Dendroctonus ponderosae]KAH1024406.1 hypothetical protein HUJ05_003891 [Dendroctonus ponderosae]
MQSAALDRTMAVRCRLCADFCYGHLEIADEPRINSMIEFFFQFKIESGGKLPSTACDACLDHVDRMWQFKEQVDRAQLLLNGLANSTDITNIVLDNQVVNTQPQQAAEESDVVEPISKPETHNLAVDVSKDKCSCDEKPEEKSAKASKKPRRRTAKIEKKSKPSEAETFKEIEYVNPDGSIVPKMGIGGWNSYHWNCSECATILFAADDLREHFATAHNVTSVRYLCVDCPKVYSKYISFIRHVRYHRPCLKFTCDVCYKWYATPKEVESHQRSHSEEDPYHCTICGKRFRVQSLLSLHTRSHLPSNVKNCYPCNHCPKKFGTKPNLMAHKRIHLGIREYTCDQCGKSFVQKGNLDNHTLTHNSDRPFQCTICEKSFKSLVRLRKHSSIHSGLKPHQCDICGRQFRERGTLKEHHRIHTGAMPFTCEFCGKCFRFKGVLTTHRRQHTGERPYSCTECQHHFTNWPNYNKHMKRRHGINTSVTCRTKQEIPPTGKPHRNPPGTVLAAPQHPAPVHVICQANNAPLEVYSEAASGTAFYPVLGLYGIPDDIGKGVL